MTWNFRARRFPSGSLLSFGGALILSAFISPGATGSDAPAPAVVAPEITHSELTARPAAVGRVKIAAVVVRQVAASDPVLSGLVATPDRPRLRQPVLISVEVADPFGSLERDASPVIVINGRVLGDSVVPFKERKRIVAVVRDGSRLPRNVSIQVGWLGDFERTLSEPVQAPLLR